MKDATYLVNSRGRHHADRLVRAAVEAAWVVGTIVWAESDAVSEVTDA
jgi:hypothetical protein